MPGFAIGTSPAGSESPSNTQEFHRSHRWKIENIGRKDTKKKVYVQSIQLPTLTFDEEKIKSGSSIEYRIAKKANWKDVVVKFYDVYGLYKVYEEWQRQIWCQETGIQGPVQYKGDPIFVLTDGKGAVMQRYRLFGAYPKEISHGELSYTKSDVKLLTVTYAYDWATAELLDAGQPNAPSTPTSGSATDNCPPNNALQSAANSRLDASGRLRPDETRHSTPNPAGPFSPRSP